LELLNINTIFTANVSRPYFMKKILLTLSILLSCFSLSLESSFAQNESTAKISKSEKQDLIDDWVDYKLIEYQMDAYLNQQKNPNIDPNDQSVEAYSEQIKQNFKQYFQQYKISYQQLKSRTSEMHDLIQLQLQYLDLTKDLMFNPKYEDTQQHPNQEKQVVLEQYQELNEQIKKDAAKIELQMLEYQKSFR